MCNCQVFVVIHPSFGSLRWQVRLTVITQIIWRAWNKTEHHTNCNFFLQSNQTDIESNKIINCLKHHVVFLQTTQMICLLKQSQVGWGTLLHGGLERRSWCLSPVASCISCSSSDCDAMWLQNFRTRTLRGVGFSLSFGRLPGLLCYKYMLVDGDKVMFGSYRWGLCVCVCLWLFVFLPFYTALDCNCMITSRLNEWMNWKCCIAWGADSVEFTEI